MPVKGNEESGVLSQQTNNCFAGIPIKKRRFPVIPPPSPPREETPTDSPRKNDGMNKEESSSGKEPCLNANLDNLDIDSPDKFDVSKNLLKEVKKEVPVAINVNQINLADLSGSGSRETSTAFSPGSVNIIIDRKVNPSLVEPASSLIVPGSKKQIITHQARGYFEHELSAGSRNIELSLRSKEQLVFASGHIQTEGSSQMPDKVDPSLLTLSLSGENPNTESNTMNSGQTTTTTTARAHGGANRSNWDLNTTMDSWGSSVKDTVGIDGLNKTRSYDVKPSSSVGVAIVKGKQVVNPSEKISNPCNSSMSSGLQYKSEESLHLSLGTFLPQSDFSKEYSTSSPKVGSCRITSDSNLQKLTTNINSGCRIVKTEPMDENLRLNSLPFNSNPMGSLEPMLVKREIVDRHNMEASKMSSSNPQKLVESGSVKSEMGQKSDKDTCGDTTKVIIRQSIEKVVQPQESSSSSSTIISMPLTPQQPGSSLVPDCLKVPGSGCLRDLSEHSLPTREVCNSNGTMDRPAPDMISKLENHIGIESNLSDCKVYAGQAEDFNVEGSEISRLERTDEIGSTAEGPICDEEKINISANTVEEDAYGSEYESDGDRSLGGQVDMEDERCGKEDNEYEDGEVREVPIRSSVEDPTFEVIETPNAKHAEDDTEMAHPIFPCDCSTEQYHVDEKQSNLEIIDETNSDHTRVSIGLINNGNSDQLIEVEFSTPKSLSETAVRADERRPESAPLDQSREKDVVEANRKDLSGDEATTVNCGMVTPVDDVTREIIQGTNVIGNAESSKTKAESSHDGHYAAKESVTGGNRSRIIHLPRASNFTSPSRMRSIPGRSLPSRGGRERCFDLERDNLHVRGNRDDIYADIPNKFSRDRKQNQSYRNSRDFMRGRGRVSGRVDTYHGEWDPPDHNFASRTFEGPVGYRFARHKRDGGHECSDFVAAPDETAVGASRGLRKPLTEELYSFRHSSSRRISPDPRDVPVTRNNQMLHRLQRNTGEAGSDLAGLRHEKKFTRNLPDDMTDSVYTRPQAGYEELDGQFVQGNRKFSTAQRRGFPCVRSKSPINNRSRSPRPWISPRRRLTDGFNNTLADQHRSPAMYRMRSPGRVSYIEEMGSRRHVSPNYLARPSNEMNSARGRGHIRSINSGGRSPSDRVFPRSNRRVDVVDTRKSSRGDDYFDGGPIHAGRFHEFRGDGSSDERKTFGERRSPVPSFRPTTFSGNNGDGYGLNSDDGSRPRRFFPDQDTEIFERGGNIRERDFDGIIKNRPLRRIRNIEEQEVNYRQTGQIWHDDAFSDDSRLKRRRF